MLTIFTTCGAFISLPIIRFMATGCSTIFTHSCTGIPFMCVVVATNRTVTILIKFTCAFIHLISANTTDSFMTQCSSRCISIRMGFFSDESTTYFAIYIMYAIIIRYSSTLFTSSLVSFCTTHRTNRSMILSSFYPFYFSTTFMVALLTTGGTFSFRPAFSTLCWTDVF